MAELSPIERARLAAAAKLSKSFESRLGARRLTTPGKGSVNIDVSAGDLDKVIKRIADISRQVEQELDDIMASEADKAVERIKDDWPTLLEPGSRWKEPTGFSRSRWRVERGRGRLEWFITNDANYAAYVHPVGSTITLMTSVVGPWVRVMQNNIATRITDFLSKLQATGTTQRRVGGGASSGVRSAISRIRSLFGL